MRAVLVGVGLGVALWVLLVGVPMAKVLAP